MSLVNTSLIQTVVITGAAGLIGSAVAQILLSRRIKVVACDDFSIGSWRGENEHLIWVKADVSTSKMTSLLGKYNPDAVIHCAAHPGGLSLLEPVENVKVNTLGSMRVFDWCARAQKPVIYLSSSAVYGEQPAGRIKESAELRPGTIYAACKVACESFLKILGEGYGLQWTVLRLFATYGAGHKPGTFQGVANIMLTQLMVGNKVIVKGSLERERDMLYVDDAVEAINAAILCDEALGEVINIGTGITVTIKDLIVELAGILGRDFNQLQIIEEAGTPGDPFFNVADISKAVRMLKYEPKVSWKQGLRILVQERLKQGR